MQTIIQLSLSWMGSYMEIFEARVLGEIYMYIRGLNSVQSGVLPVYYSDHDPSKIMIITSQMQKLIQIYSCLLKLLRKQNTILNIGDFSTKN
jgi:hypothetical protein